MEVGILKADVSMQIKCANLQFYHHFINKGKARDYDHLVGLIKNRLFLSLIIIFPRFLNPKFLISKSGGRFSLLKWLALENIFDCPTLDRFIHVLGVITNT